MKNITPYIHVAERDGTWHSFFAIRLRSIRVFDPSQEKHKDFAFNLLNRQIDFINTLDRPEDGRVINLRFICRPDPSFYRNGKIETVLITRLPGKDKKVSREAAQSVFRDMWSVLTTISDHYEFEPVMGREDFLSCYKPFKITGISEVFRRDDIIGDMKRVRGFDRTEKSASLCKDHIYYVYPFIWGTNSLARTCKAMLFHPEPTMISILLKPVLFTKELENIFTQHIHALSSTITLKKSDKFSQLIHKNLHSQLIRLEDSPFYMKIHIASSDKVPQGVIDTFGVEVTEHSGSPDVMRAIHDEYEFSGGYEWHRYDDPPTRDHVEEDIRWLDVKFRAPTIAPDHCAQLRYLFDASQANCAFRFPIPQVKEIQGVKTSYFRSVPPPSDAPKTGITMGFSRNEGLVQEVGLLREDRRKHTYVVGQTGTGKSTMLLNLILQDIENGEGLAVLDPHGELVTEILPRVPDHRLEDIIYINFADTERPITINMLDYESDLEKDMGVQLLFEIFDQLYDMKTVSGPMFEMYMKNALYLIMEDPSSGSTLLEIQKVFADREFRHHKISKARNKIIKEFWVRIAEEAGGEASLRNLSPYVVSKLTMFVYNNMVRNIISSQRTSVDFNSAMNEGKVVLVDLCKGKIGALVSRFLGMVIVSKILINTLGRSKVGDKKSLRDFFLYVDEFQSMATDSFVTLLSEARKYRLSAILANQYLTQIPKEVLNAIFGNVGTLISFRLGKDDAALIEKEFFPSFTAKDLTNLPNWRICVKMLANGMILRPFELKTFPPSEEMDEGKVKKIIEMSRETYGVDVSDIEMEVDEREQYLGL